MLEQEVSILTSKDTHYWLVPLEPPVGSAPGSVWEWLLSLRPGHAQGGPQVGPPNLVNLWGR